MLRAPLQGHFPKAITSGLGAVECPDAVDAVKEGDQMSIDFAKGEIKTPYGECAFPSMPGSGFSILEAGEVS